MHKHHISHHRSFNKCCKQYRGFKQVVVLLEPFLDSSNELLQDYKMLQLRKRSCSCLLQSAIQSKRQLNTESLIGSKATIERRKQEYEEKYKDLLQNAAKECVSREKLPNQPRLHRKGVQLEELLERAKAKTKALNRQPLPKPKGAQLQQVKAGSLKKEAVSQSGIKVSLPEGQTYALSLRTAVPLFHLGCSETP